MVRRRARSNKVHVTGADNENKNQEFQTHALPNGSILEDQYFASPKRKDCKIDDNVGVIEPNGMEERKEKERNKAKTKSKERSSGIEGKVIGVPLATRSQTRTIENFFKAKTAARNKQRIDEATLEYEQELNEQLNIHTSNDAASMPLSINSPLLYESLPFDILANDEHYHQQKQSSSPAHYQHLQFTASHLPTTYIFDLSEDTNDTDNTEYSAEDITSSACVGYKMPIMLGDFMTHRNPLRDSHSSHGSVTDNIFLQEPVLSLNVDKCALSQASCIKINRTLETEPVFSSPPRLTAANLNGCFNQIISLAAATNLGTSPSKTDVQNMPKTTNDDNDNSSCDSGIAFTHSQQNSPLEQVQEETIVTVQATPAQARRRKPATPHRIVCCSPVKPAARVSPLVTKVCDFSVTPRKKEQLSPRKSPRHLTVGGTTTNVAATSKTRRRLTPSNKEEEQGAIYMEHEEIMQIAINEQTEMEPTNKCKDNIIIIDDDDQEFKNHQHVHQSRLLNGLSTNNNNNIINKNFNIKTINSTKHITAHQKQQKHHTKTKSAQKISALETHVKTHQTQPKMKQQPLAITNGNREMTEFFPVRRSVRKTKSAVKEEIMRNFEQAILEGREEGLKVAHFENKGRGIIADRRFERGEFVVEYIGDLISMGEATEREKRYALDENAGCYMYYFKHKNQQYCIDATTDTGKLGRLVNHSRNGNLMTKVIVVKQCPHLILIAKDDIEPGEELTYDYGDRSKESLLHHPWLAF